MTSIQLERVSKEYGPVAAVKDLSLSIAPGEFVSLLGPSGSGKTTTMRMVAGLEKATSGTIRIGGKVMSDGETFVPVHKRQLGMVFQSYAVWPHKTVLENVAFPLRMRGFSSRDQKERSLRMLQRVGLGGQIDRYPSQLSGGQQQRVSLARALVAEPHVILLDEPLSNLDAQLRDSMRELLSELHKSIGITSIYVTHDQSEAMALSDRVYLMGNGALMQSGAPEDLYERPADRFVAEFLGMANTLSVKPLGPDTVQFGNVVLGVASISGNSRDPTLIVRPHRLLLTDATDEPNTLSGTIRSVSYLGDRLRYSVGLGPDSALVVEDLKCSRRASVGEAVHILLPREHCVVI